VSEQDQLYQDLIMDHFKNPRHADKIEDADCRMEEFNPACGDVVRLTWGEDLSDLRHDTRGCAITTASASIMTEQLRGLDAEAANEAIDALLEAFKTEDARAERDENAALLTVKNYPMRIQCATLPWVALKKALESRL